MGALRDWAASGAMALTGRRHDRPRAAPGDPAGALRRDLEEFGRLTRERTGTAPELPGVELLGERAAIAGLTRNGPWSCGGAFRAVRTADGWIGLSLPREADLSLIPALVESAVVTDLWAAVDAWAQRRTATEAAERIRLLGLAGGPIPLDPLPAGDRPSVLVGPGGRRSRLPERPVVVDLTSLWAGPLCAHLLGLAGAEVIKVESPGRPDGARQGPLAFFNLLHAGHRMVSLDLGTPEGRARLRGLIARADLVLEASRPRALRQLGIIAEEVVDNGTSWLSLTAYGRERDWIGFGDDVAACAGLVVPDSADLLPCGDALADPLSGVAAAVAAGAALQSERATLIEVSMKHVAAATRHAPVADHAVVRRRDEWWVETADGDFPVLPPRARKATRAAGRSGADNASVLA